jgi:hypothetical protein
VRALLALLLAPACSGSPRAPAGPEAPHLVVPQLEHRVRIDGIFYRAEIPFRYTNRTADTLVLTGCRPPGSPIVEWWDGTRWRLAFDHVTDLCLSPPFAIPPRTTVHDTLYLVVSRDSIAPSGNLITPHWLASTGSGEYRLVWSVQDQAAPSAPNRSHGGAARPLAERISNTFRLTVPPR